MLKSSVFRTILFAGLAALAASGTVQSKGFSRPGPLPGMESNLQACLDGVGRLGHEAIDDPRIVARHGQRFYIFLTRDANGIDSMVACASADGRIVQTVGLDRL